MRIKGLCDEDFVNYKKPSMTIITCFCSFKCDIENGERCCQNSTLAKAHITSVPDDALIQRYINNPISKSVVFCGLEPFDQFDEIFSFIKKMRVEYNCDDDIVIYTGYYKYEKLSEITRLRKFKNIIVKYGRFIPNNTNHFDEVLGVSLASMNQFAEKIS